MNQALTVDITSLGGLGDGLSKLNGKPLFVEKSAPGDRLSIRIVHETKEALRGEIIEVLQGGPERVAPICPHFSACGGCSLQQLSTNFYQESKRKVLKSALAHAGFGDMEADVIFLPVASRRRVELKAAHLPAGLSFAYYAPRSRDLVAINACPILEPVLQNLLQPLAAELGKWHAVRAIKTVSLTAADSGIDMVIECSSLVENTNALEKLAESLDIARITLQAPEQKPVVIVTRRPLTMRLGKYDVALPPGAFLQASKEGQRILTESVIAAVGDSKSIADLFCGIGTYGFSLSQHLKIHAVESDADMVRGLKAMIHLHGRQRNFSAEQRDLFTDPLPAKQLVGFDCIILNPPRPGAKAQTQQIAQAKVPTVIMVSCNPASFARDAKTLKDAGYTMISAKGLDQFVYSPHLEIVAVFQIPA